MVRYSLPHKIIVDENFNDASLVMGWRAHTLCLSTDAPGKDRSLLQVETGCTIVEWASRPYFWILVGGGGIVFQETCLVVFVCFFLPLCLCEELAL